MQQFRPLLIKPTCCWPECLLSPRCCVRFSLKVFYSGRQKVTLVVDLCYTFEWQMAPGSQAPSLWTSEDSASKPKMLLSLSLLFLSNGLISQSYIQAHPHKWNQNMHKSWLKIQRYFVNLFSPSPILFSPSINNPLSHIHIPIHCLSCYMINNLIKYVPLKSSYPLCVSRTLPSISIGTTQQWN